jgi:ABC-type sugar transport system permease subunit
MCKVRRQYTNRYNKVIRVSVGLIIGLIIDKVLFFKSKGLSVFIPPFAVMLMSKGYVFKEIEFQKDFGFFNKFVNHLVVK